MALTPQQIARLANAIDQNANLPALMLWALDLQVNLDNLVPAGSVLERAFKLISHLSERIPPRDRELLELLQQKGNAALKAVAAELLKPNFFSPTGDAHDAILLGRFAFVDREDLRQRLREFTNPSPSTTRVLVVRGAEPGGKSYTWKFLQHLAVNSSAIPQRLPLQGTSYLPRQLMEQVFRLIGLDPVSLPKMSDDPQPARIDPLINEFRGRIVLLPKAYWLVIDDLNDPSVTPAMRETVFAMAASVEELKPANLWLALLGYNEPIVAPDLRYIAGDDAEFPPAARVAKHFELLAKSGPKPLASDRALEIANLVFAKYSKLDKEAMTKITVDVEVMGEKLRQGLQP